MPPRIVESPHPDLERYLHVEPRAVTVARATEEPNPVGLPLRPFAPRGVVVRAVDPLKTMT